MENIDGLKLVRLTDNYVNSLTNFNCFDENEIFEGFRSKQKKKFKIHSENINNFLINEALNEQNEGLNTTYLLIKGKEVLGFISLCTDSIRLQDEEKIQEHLIYANIPAIKIARLGIDKKYQHKKLGHFMIKFAVSIAVSLRQFVGVKFITVDCYQHRISYYNQEKFCVNGNQIPDRQPDNPLSLRLNIDKYLEEINL